MRRITAFLDDVVEERNRRARKAAAAALVLAALGLAAAMRPAPKPEIVYRTRVEYRYGTEYIYAGVITGRRPGRPATAGGTPALQVGRDFGSFTPPPAPSPLERHLCLSPRSIAIRRGTATITVSNPSPGEIGITGIRASSYRYGLDFDASDCRDRVLREGERCVINVLVKPHIGQTMTLLVADDASTTPESMTVEALK